MKKEIINNHTNQVVSVITWDEETKTFTHLFDNIKTIITGCSSYEEALKMFKSK